VNKRGIILGFALVILSIGAFIALFFVMKTLSQATAPLYTIGERSFEVTKAYAEGEKLSLFVDQSARLASRTAREAVAFNGGFASHAIGDTVCGQSQFSGYVALNKAAKPDTLCASDVGQQLGIATRTALMPYLAQYAKNVFDPDLYDFSVVNNELLGIASAPVDMRIYSPLAKGIPATVLPVPTELWERNIAKLFSEPVPNVIPVEKTPGLPVGEYFVRPSFRVPLYQDITVYDTLRKLAQQTVRDCSLAEMDAKATCARAKFAQAGFSGPGVNDSVVFSALAKGSQQGIDEDALLFIVNQPAEIQIRFALFVPSPPAVA